MYEKGLNMQDIDFQYFKENREKYISEHPDEYVLIKDKKELGFFYSENEAINYAIDNGHILGSFIVQKCIPADQDIQKFHSRVAFR